MFTLAFPPRGDVVNVQFWGSLNADDFISSVDEMLSHTRWRDGIKALWIFHQGVDPAAIDYPAMEGVLLPALKARAERLGAAFKVALLIADAEHVPLYELWVMIPEVRQLELFREFDRADAALDWLNAPKLEH